MFAKEYESENVSPTCCRGEVRTAAGTSGPPSTIRLNQSSPLPSLRSRQGSRRGPRLRRMPPPGRPARARVLTSALAGPRPRVAAPAAARRATPASRSPRRVRTLSRSAQSGLDQRAAAGPVPPPTGLEEAPSTQWGRAAASLFASARAAGATAAAAEDDSESSCEEELPGRAAVRADARRAAARVRRMAKEELPPGQTFLEAHSVKAPTRARYQMHVDELIRFADVQEARLVEDTEVDDCVAKWMNAEFSAGRRAWRGESMLAALMFMFPAFSRNGDRKLPRAFRCLRGWRLLSPPMSRTPLPWPMWAAVALQLMRHGHGLAAIAVLVMVEAYLRPSELLSLTRRSLLRPARGGLTKWSLLLFPSARGVARSKTGEADDTVVMDSARTPWIGYVLSRLADGPGDERVFPWDYSQFYQMFVQASAALGYKMVPYQGRHSGISIDRAHRERSLDECMKRGRWKAARSVARYEKAGRLNDAWAELTPVQQAHALDCEARLEECIVRGHRLPTPAPRP